MICSQLNSPGPPRPTYQAVPCCAAYFIQNIPLCHVCVFTWESMLPEDSSVNSNGFFVNEVMLRTWCQMPMIFYLLVQIFICVTTDLTCLISTSFMKNCIEFTIYGEVFAISYLNIVVSPIFKIYFTYYTNHIFYSVLQVNQFFAQCLVQR